MNDVSEIDTYLKFAVAEVEEKTLVPKAKGEISWNIPQPSDRAVLAPEPESQPTGKYVPGTDSIQRTRTPPLIL